MFLLTLPVSPPSEGEHLQVGQLQEYSNVLNPERLAIEHFLEIIRINLLTYKRENQSQDIFSLCQRLTVSPHQVQAPSDLPSVPGLCSLPRPQWPAMIDRGQQPHGAGPSGDHSLRRCLSNSKDLSLPSPELLAGQPVSDLRVSKTGCGMLLGSVLLTAVKFLRHQVPTLSAALSYIWRRL